MTTTENSIVAKLARQLYRDDLSRADEAPIQRDGRKAYDGWLQASRDAGDTETRDALLAVDRDDFAAAWDALVEESDESQRRYETSEAILEEENAVSAAAIRSLADARVWALEAEAGDYLVEYEEDGLDEVSDPGSRCGFGDDELAEIDAILARRDLRLVADDCGLVAEARA